MFQDSNSDPLPISPFMVQLLSSVYIGAARLRAPPPPSTACRLHYIAYDSYCDKYIQELVVRFLYLYLLGTSQMRLRYRPSALVSTPLRICTELGHEVRMARVYCTSSVVFNHLMNLNLDDNLYIIPHVPYCRARGCSPARAAVFCVWLHWSHPDRAMYATSLLPT